jgi:predicted TIM-barrel fold metal-dependent hydrolase
MVRHWRHHRGWLAEIRALGLSPADEQLILGGNAGRLLQRAR